jgi:hypothetical protein
MISNFDETWTPVEGISRLAENLLLPVTVSKKLHTLVHLVPCKLLGEDPPKKIMFAVSERKWLELAGKFQLGGYKIANELSHEAKLNPLLLI